MGVVPGLVTQDAFTTGVFEASRVAATLTLIQQYDYPGQEMSPRNEDETLRSFEKGLAGRGGWREEILPMGEIQTSFLCPFSYATISRRGTQFWESIIGCIWGPVSRQPPPRQPFSKPLKQPILLGILGQECWKNGPLWRGRIKKGHKVRKNYPINLLQRFLRKVQG